MSFDLYDHQIQAVKELDNGKILVGGVGSGKSRTALCYYYVKIGGGSIESNGRGCWRKMKHAVPLYIITTARKRDTRDWEEEGAPFLLSGFTVDSWNNISKYKDVKDAFFIFDEQRVVGSGVWVKSFLAIAKKNRWILLSATPGDTWIDYIPVFIANGFYKNRTAFLQEHVIFSRFAKYPKIDRYVATKKLERFRQQIVVNMEFTKPTVQHHMDVACDYDKQIFRTVVKDRWDPYAGKPLQDISSVCYCMRKVVNSDETRMRRVEEILKRHKKAIIFYNFDYELEALRKLSCPVSEWNGHKHEPIRKGPSWAYLVQYTAGAEGWNCTDTDTLIFYSQNYSYKVMVQAAGRIDRMNTPYKDLYYYHLKSASPIDIAINRALKAKRNFNEKIFMKER